MADTLIDDYLAGVLDERRETIRTLVSDTATMFANGEGFSM